MARLLAIDLGTVRVGLAVTDPSKIIASPYKVIKFISQKQLINEIAGICKDMDVSEVIIGLPLREDGTEGAGCERARRLASELETEGIKTNLWDERYSSKIAELSMREMGKKQKESRKDLDSIAASIILENYMRYKDRNK